MRRLSPPQQQTTTGTAPRLWRRPQLQSKTLAWILRSSCLRPRLLQGRTREEIPRCEDDAHREHQVQVAQDFMAASLRRLGGERRQSLQAKKQGEEEEDRRRFWTLRGTLAE